MSGMASQNRPQAKRPLQFRETCELLAVVECQRLQEVRRQVRHQPDDDRRACVGLLRRHMCEENEARHALGQRGEVAGALPPIDEIALPVPDARPVLDRLRALVDVNAVGNLPATGVAVLLRVAVARLALPPAHRKRRQVLAGLLAGVALPDLVRAANVSSCPKTKLHMRLKPQMSI